MYKTTGKLLYRHTCKFSLMPDYVIPIFCVQSAASPELGHIYKFLQYFLVKEPSLGHTFICFYKVPSKRAFPTSTYASIPGNILH